MTWITAGNQPEFQNRLNPDLLLYIAWQLGVATNQEIGEKFGLTYSAASQRVGLIRNMLNKDK